MAPSKDTTMSASSSQIRKRKGRADSPSSSNDTASVPAPVKTVQATNGTNGTNGANGNGVAALKASNASKDFITGQTVLNGKNVSSKTQIRIQTEIRSFECVKHVKPAQFPEVLGALPFPQELRSMVAWTDAFVQRLGWMALLQEQNAAKEKLSTSRAEKKNEELALRIQELQTKVHDLIDDNHDLRGKNAQLTSRNRFLEGHNKRDDKQIEAFKASISEKQTEIWNLTKENEKLRSGVESLEKQVKKLIEEYKGEKSELIAAFEMWKSIDDEEDKKREALVTQLQTALDVEKAAKTKAETDLLSAKTKLAELEADNARLNSKQSQLDELVKNIRAQLQKAETDLGVSQGVKATLEEQLNQLTKKEKDAQLEIQSLLGKLNEAKIDVEAAKEQVFAANEHAKSHWHTLQTIRADGGWLSTEEKDSCDGIFLAKPFMCEFQADPTAKKPVALVSKPICTLEVDPKVENAADIENPFN
ncbi:uncharacterized protein N7484_007530 [Penicillium longicatenatum]|uniref:uncharacterized protein n=1 Tax=Penicillium longicatenatum TaxID=1561947 RepID=UPI002547445E|nr:uncharacterized protein N7484_007530 [Penicillium longicatenatum]KAJ5639668.1 hypothetical protein N7484_007530 [Penicillium longicatenatum]